VNVYIIGNAGTSIVILFEGSIETLHTRVLSSGRHKNEYWNIVTPFSITAGIFVLLFLALYFIGRPALGKVVVYSFCAVFLPLFPLIPPGLLLTMLYQRLWKDARLAIIRRDMVLLEMKNSLRIVGESAENQTGQAKNYFNEAFICEAAAWFFLFSGIGVNIFFAVIIINLLM
jgi:hypothetical protein